MSMAFTTSNAEGPVDFINMDDLEKMAQKVVPKGAFGYIASGAGDTFTMHENLRAFNHKLIVPHTLMDVEDPDTTTTFAGENLPAPMIMAPVAAHKLANEQGEVASAKGVADYGSLYTISSYSSVDLPAVTRALHGAPQWFQFYFSKDNGVNRHIIDRVKEQGIKAIVLTADAMVGGNRETDARNGFTFPIPLPIVQEYLPDSVGKTMDYVYKSAKQKLSPKDVEFIAEYSDLPVYVKGPQSKEDVDRALSAGAAGIWVSNHGGRQLDGGPAAFDSLQEVAKAVDHRVPVIFDSGIRRGQHIFKAIASGADVVALGRPVIYGLAVGGSVGVRQTFEKLQAELKLVMQLAGTQTVEDIKHFELRDNPYNPSFDTTNDLKLF